MERRPEFTVIAGPNGAGKSRLCPFYVSKKSFDGDKLALNIRKEHPDWPEHWISGTVASELEKQKNHALELREDFAFETNFSNEMVINMIQEFKDAGYKISLCYFGLNSENESVSRVILNLTFIDGNSDFGKIVALHIEKNGKHEVTNNPPLWFKMHFEKPFADLT